MDEMQIALFNLMSNWQCAQQRKARSHHKRNSTLTTIFFRVSTAATYHKESQRLQPRQEEGEREKKKNHWKCQNLKGCLFSAKKLCNWARHKCKTPWQWHRNVKTCRSIYYI